MAECLQAQAEHCMELVGHVKRAAKDDYKAALALLKTNPMTRADFKEDKGEQRIEVVMSFDRKGIIIDGKPQSITMDD